MFKGVVLVVAPLAPPPAHSRDLIRHATAAPPRWRMSPCFMFTMIGHFVGLEE